MSIGANRPAHYIFWWIYAPYPVFALLLTTYVRIASHRYPAVSLFSFVLDALGLFCFYCFLRQKATFTLRFWVRFANLYILKLGLSLALMVAICARAGWNIHSLWAVAINFAGLILGVPLLVAIVLYAYRSKHIWDSSQADLANA